MVASRRHGLLRLSTPRLPSLPADLPLIRRLPALSPLLTTLPGAEQRRRALQLLAASGLVLLLRPWPPFVWLPGWCVGLLLLLTVLQGVQVLLWPRRWR